MFLVDVCRTLTDSGVSFGIAGGYAVSLHGAVRGTLDVDIVLAHREESYVKAEAALRKLGLDSRIPVTAKEVFRFRREYLDTRNLVAWSFVDAADPTRIVDIVLTFDKARVPTKRIEIRGQSIPVLSKRALIEMKTGTGRPQDEEDVRALRRIQ